MEYRECSLIRATHSSNFSGPGKKVVSNLSGYLSNLYDLTTLFDVVECLAVSTEISVNLVSLVRLGQSPQLIQKWEVLLGVLWYQNMKTRGHGGMGM